MSEYDFPTIQWVKDRITLATGLPSGRMMDRRHFPHCEHWFREDDDVRLKGGPARLATHNEMNSLAPCKTCIVLAAKHADPVRGPRNFGLPRRYWWVSQGYNYPVAIEQQTLWSLPKKGRELPDRRLLRHMAPGDVVLHYADNYMRAVSVVSSPWEPAKRPEGYRMREQDGDDGWLVRVEVKKNDLDLPRQEISQILPHGTDPLDKNGMPRQIYVAVLPELDAYALLEAAGVVLPASTSEESLFGLPTDRYGGQETESEVLTRIRLEQSHLRQSLLQGRTEAACSICGATLPSHLLVAAHIVPRRDLSDQERWDFASAAMLACVLGCDALFEWGHLTVHPSGLVQRGVAAENPALERAVEALTGRICSAHNALTASRFAVHCDRVMARAR